VTPQSAAMTDEKELIDVLNRYADVVTAFAFAESIAFAGGMLANDRFANAVHRGIYWAVPLTLIFYLAYFGFLYFSCQGIRKLQQDLPRHRFIALKWARRVWGLRLFIVFLSLAITLLGFVLPPLPTVPGAVLD
jgi:hypothetical protein